MEFEVYVDFILSVLDSQLDSWQVYRDKFQEWLETRSGERPNNPMYINQLSSAFETWGITSVNHLLERLGHSEASTVIPIILTRIMNQPWTESRDENIHFLDAFVEGEKRRELGKVLLQPNHDFQGLTDITAENIGEMLVERVKSYVEEAKSQGDEFNPIGAGHYISELMKPLSNVASSKIIEPIEYALEHGYYSIYALTDVCLGLIKQGYYIESKVLVQALENKFQEEVVEEWHDDQLKNQLSEVCRFLLTHTDPSLLSNPIDYYFEQWVQFDRIDDVVSELKYDKNNVAFDYLLRIPGLLPEGHRFPGHFAEVMISHVNEDNFSGFMVLIENEDFFNWIDSQYRLHNHFSIPLAKLISQNPALYEKFSDICLNVNNPGGLIFLSGVISNLEDNTEACRDLIIRGIKEESFDGERGPLFDLFKSLFYYEQHFDDGAYYEVYPRSCNSLRNELYELAKSSDTAGLTSKKLLICLENMRWESGRPVDECVNPDLDNRMHWRGIPSSLIN